MLLPRQRAVANQSPDKGSLLSSVDDRLISAVRLILACAALAIIFIDPSEPDRLVFITYSALFFYVAYSALLYLRALRSCTLVPSRPVHWIDVGWSLLLVSLSSGTSSIFFFFFFYAIMVASFRWGFREGMTVTIAAAILFTVIGYATAPVGYNFELNRFLLRPIYLLLLGYLMAYWGGAEIELKRRLALLREVNTLSNPRFGVGQTVVSIMKRVRAHYSAGAALLILGGPSASKSFQLIRVEANGEAEEVQRDSLPAELARQFLTLPESLAACYSAARRFPFWSGADYLASDIITGERATEGKQECARLAALLDAESFITLPLVYRGRNRGRFFLTRDYRGFEASDVELLQQIAEGVMPVISNVRLLDQLASKAAEQERQKIARDLHDSVIQPYIGLQYKLAAIRSKLGAGELDIAHDLEQLFDTTVSEITGLRHYVRELRDEASASDHLMAAIRRYTEQFQENYGINVEVVSEGNLLITDRLAAELIQMVHEGLINAWKHTEATRCIVRLDSVDNNLVLCIENNNAPPRAERVPFKPRSLTERAASLGGRMSVEHVGTDQTVICVQIPL
jgi:signal transduction histidine kinase